MIVFSDDFKYQKLVYECIDELETLGDNYQIIQDLYFSNFKGNSKGGDCRREQKGKYRIRINQDLINNDEIKGIIIHELLHTFNGCMKHTGEWRRRADYVNHKLGYDIQRICNISLATDSHHYELICKYCGARIIYYNRTKAIKYFEENPDGNRFWCNRCGYNSFNFREVI